MRKVSLLVILSFLLTSTVGYRAVGQTAKTPGGLTNDLMSHSVGRWGLDFNDRDPSVRPGDNFYLSQNGAWFARTELGPNAPFAAYWNDLRSLSPRRLVAILEDAAANKSASLESIEGKAGALYRAFMDEKRIEELGLSPLQPQLEVIRAAKTRSQFAALTGLIAGPGTVRAPSVLGRGLARGLFQVNIGQDLTDPNRNVVYLNRGGMLLPGQEYYMDPQLADIKTGYQTYVAKMLTLIGWPNPEANAREIVSLESRIAEVAWSHERTRPESGSANLVTVDELCKVAPDFDWREFLKGAELGDVDKLVIGTRPFFTKIAEIFAETPIEILQARQAFDAADNGAANLNSAMVMANFDFRFKAFNNQSAVIRPRNSRGERTVEASLTEIVAALYVRQYFSPEVKARAEEMAANLKMAFDARLEKLTWMSAETKAKARSKLAKMAINIGHPEKFDDYKGLKIDDQDLYGDVKRAAAFNWRASVAQLKKPFDRSTWSLTPNYPQYNYDPLRNTVEAPAALLQPPFFDPKADDAINYGAVGSLMGLMIEWGFDDQGGQFDGDGRRRDWFTADETQIFAAESKKLANQYSKVEPLPGIHIQGDRLVGESIGDLGGILMALDAYHLSLKGKPAAVLDGFTGDQRFFLGRAQMWRAKFDAPFVKNQALTAQNAPPFLRINGPLPNIDEWYTAFDVKPGDKMYMPPSQRVRIW